MGVISGGVAAAGGCLGYAVRGRSSSLLAPSIYRGDPTRRTVALTFDDGPSESTPALLKLLEAHRVRATFFMCGANVRRLPHIAQEVVASGHEIGNHSDTHARFDFKSAEFIYHELASAQESIHTITGSSPNFFRAPYGVRWFGLRRAQRELGLTGVMWTVIGRDWTLPAKRISRRLIDGAANGAILCLHDGRITQASPDIGRTIEAVGEVIPRLHDRGLQFQTVGGLLCSPIQSRN